MTVRKASAIGFGAVALWAMLALLSVAAGPVPPFQLSAICFTIGGMIGLAWMAVAGHGLARLRRIEPAVWLVGIGGLFGYHFFYFTAIANAPPAEASLIAYLWPLLIVLLSGLLPGEKLRTAHVVGALIAFGGAAMLITGPSSGFGLENWRGYAAAVACAFIWSSYSVAMRRLGEAPTETVAVFCLATAALSFGAHLLWEETIWPAGATAWAAVVGLGIGPVGLAFYLWDIGVKRGNIQLLGVASYAAPLLSTLILVGAGIAAPTLGLLAAAALITGGALIAARA